MVLPDPVDSVSSEGAKYGSLRWAVALLRQQNTTDDRWRVIGTYLSLKVHSRYDLSLFGDALRPGEVGSLAIGLAQDVVGLLPGAYEVSVEISTAPFYHKGDIVSKEITAEVLVMPYRTFMVNVGFLVGAWCHVEDVQVMGPGQECGYYVKSVLYQDTIVLEQRRLSEVDGRLMRSLLDKKIHVQWSEGLDWL